MDDLIEALQILRKYLTDTNAQCPTNTSHDVLWIMSVDPDDVSEVDKAKLNLLGFYEDDDAFQSFRFGSA